MSIISDLRAEGNFLNNAELLEIAKKAIQETGQEPNAVLEWMASYCEWRAEFAGYADRPKRPCPQGSVEEWFREHKPVGFDYFKGPKE